MISLDPSGEVPMSRLIQDLEDGVITPADRERLMEQLRRDPAARELYLKHIRLSALLRQTAETRADLGTMPVSMEMLARAKRKSAITALAGGIAAVLVIALTLMAFQVRLTFASPPPTITMESSQDATYQIDWSGDAARSYDQFQPGDRVTLDRGLLRFRFPSDVEAIIEGPSELELLSTSEIRLNGGMGWFRVPEAGQGFTVLTDRAKVIDLGTEFGLVFEHGGVLQVHVAEGNVRVKPHAIGTSAFELVEGEAVGIDTRGKSNPVDARPTLFRREFTHTVPYLHWSFDFLVNGAFPATGSIPDAADYRAHLRHIDGGEISADDQRRSQAEGIRGQAFTMHGDGRFAESTFPGIGDHVPRTVAAWMRHRGGETRAVDPVSDPRTGHGATTPFGDQAYLLNYTNSGLVTAEGAIGELLTADSTYTLSFHVAALPEIGAGNYHVELVAFDPEHDNQIREDIRLEFRAGTVLAQSSGQTTTSDMTTRDEIVFTAPPGDASLGKELAVRLVKVGNPVIYDNLHLTRKTGDGETKVVFEESFESPVVTGYAEHVLPSRGWVGPVPGWSSMQLGFGATRHGLFSQRPVFSTPYVAWDGGSGSRFAAFVLPTEPLRWSIADGKGFSDSPPSDPILADEWTHVATVHTGHITSEGHPEILHYINGRLVESEHLAASFVDSPQDAAPAPLHIGILPGANPGSPTLDGDIDELFIFRSALDEAEIQSIMRDNRAVFPRKR